MNGAFFPLAKLGWTMLAPSHLLLWLSLLTALVLIAGGARLGRWLALATALLFMVFGMLPTGDWLAQNLEDQYPRPATLPAHIDGIVDLGGGLGADILAERHAPATALTEARLVSTFELARRYPSARVVFSGGWGPYADAVGAAYVFGQMGLDPARLTLESRSRDTFENLLFTQRLVQPKRRETWVLATSAIQMPRAMLVARKLGWDMIPWPTDYLTRPARHIRPPADYLDVAGNLMRADAAMHEELGLLAYRLRGGGGTKAAPRNAAPRNASPGNAAPAGALSNASNHATANQASPNQATAP
ncbi:MAG TPA: YdcF family protein [Caulobacteraceae bacterium]|nr:YdcF family protein [Caulobacteraceae bacterium]